ncbi:MAG: hypothetical protein ACX939_01235 [Hyphococcus sp.]
MIRLSLVALAAMSFALSPVRAEDAAALLNQFEGQWTSADPAFGADAKSAMTWAAALNGQFVRLDYRIEMRRNDETADVFQGVAYYRPDANNALKAFWADTSGDLHPIRAVREADALIVHWGFAGGKQGRTRYALTAPSELTVTDWLLTGEGWRQFNQSSFQRTARKD